MTLIRPKILYPLFSELTTIHGIGAKTSKLLQKKVGSNIIDLLFHLPHSVIRRMDDMQLKSCPSHSIITKKVKITKHIQGYYKSKIPYKIIGVCENLEIEIIFFNYRNNYLKKNFPPSSIIVISGQIIWFNGKAQITHPDYIFRENDSHKIPKFETVYSLTSGLTNKIIRKSMQIVLDKIPNNLPEWIPEQLIEKRNWLPFKESLKYFHLPNDETEINLRSLCLERLSFDEVYANQLGLYLYKKKNKLSAKQNRGKNNSYFEYVLKNLDFELTKAQINCLNEIDQDINSKLQMKRLLQGDVGSGKTLVALSAILNLVEEKKQAVLMSPTDLLSVQHYKFIKNVTDGLKINVSLLTSKLKKSEKEKILQNIASGETLIIVGTHSLISDNVEFFKLGIAVIDEQHKFGVNQRNKILSKGNNIHLLLLTATPIPRSLTMTNYGDLDLSIINELPKNRKMVITKAMPLERYNEIIKAIGRALKRSEKVYWICPLLEMSEKLDMIALHKRYEILTKTFKIYNPVLAHGKMSKEEREEAINNFFSNKSKILVASTVIEVGIDIPDATIIIIENSERFGLAQLHQLRGRVGRGLKQSYCILMYNKNISEIGKSRLEILKSSNDGFYIAEKDLDLRGPGEIFGTKQSGEETFKLFSLKDTELLVTAKSIAKEVVNNGDLSFKHEVLMNIFNKDDFIQNLS